MRGVTLESPMGRKMNAAVASCVASFFEKSRFTRVHHVPRLYFSPYEASICLLTQRVGIQSSRESTAFDSLSGRAPLYGKWKPVSEVLLRINCLIPCNTSSNSQLDALKLRVI